MSKNEIFVVGIDKFLHKNLYQSQWLANVGLKMSAFIYEKESSYNSTNIENESIKLLINNKSYISVFQEILTYLFINRNKIHHIEVYLGSPISVFALIVSKVLNIKSICVERGGLLYYINKWCSRLTRLSYLISYKLADLIWYKEIFMEPYLKNMGLSKMFFLNNAVKIPDIFDGIIRKIDFLWVNRLVYARHPTWFAENIIRLQSNYKFNVVISGFLGHHAWGPDEDEEKQTRDLLKNKENIILKPYSDPFEYYKRAKYFVLPADVVFGNYALLEAMSYGVVPIVSDVEGADLIVEDGKNGFIVPHTAAGLLAGMERALRVDAETWEAMSRAARRRIEEKYSIEAWGNRLMEEYRALGPF